MVYTGEETIRCRLQTKVEKRQVHIQNNDPGEIKAGMKAIDVDRKCLISSLLSEVAPVVDRLFVLSWFCSCILIEDLFLDMPYADMHNIIGSQMAPHCDLSCLQIKIFIQQECVQCKDQFC